MEFCHLRNFAAGYLVFKMGALNYRHMEILHWAAQEFRK